MTSSPTPGHGPCVRSHGMKADPPGYLRSKNECFLMSGWWDIRHSSCFNVKLWSNSTKGTKLRTDERTNKHTNGRTERRKLYTPRHTCRGYKELFVLPCVACVTLLGTLLEHPIISKPLDPWQLSLDHWPVTSDPRLRPVTHDQWPERDPWSWPLTTDSWPLTCDLTPDLWLDPWPVTWPLTCDPWPWPLIRCLDPWSVTLNADPWLWPVTLDHWPVTLGLWLVTPDDDPWPLTLDP